MNEQTRLPFDDLPEPIGETASVSTVEPPARDGGADDVPDTTGLERASEAVAGAATLELPFGPDEGPHAAANEASAAGSAAGERRRRPRLTRRSSAVEATPDVDATVGGVLLNRASWRSGWLSWPPRSAATWCSSG